MYVGDATLESSGLVKWHYREELPLRLLDGEGTALVSLGETGAGRFDAAPLPESDLTLRASGESRNADTEVEVSASTGTEGAPDDHL